MRKGDGRTHTGSVARSDPPAHGTDRSYRPHLRRAELESDTEIGADSVPLTR